MRPLLLAEDELDKNALSKVREKSDGGMLGLAIASSFCVVGGRDSFFDKEINRAFPINTCKCGNKFYPKRSSHYLCEECFKKER